MVIFQSYVKLLEGNLEERFVYCESKHEGWDSFTKLMDFLIPGASMESHRVDETQENQRLTSSNPLILREKQQRQPKNIQKTNMLDKYG